MNSRVIDDIGVLADQVHRESLQADRARDDLLVGEARLLKTVLDRCKPALGPIGNRPITSYSVTDYGNPSKQRETTRHHGRKCFLLSANVQGPVETTPDDAEGQYNGRDLLVEDTGRLICFEYDGAWSRRPGSHWQWDTTVSTYSTTLDCVCGGWRAIDAYFERLARALYRAAGSRSQATTQDSHDAERVRALSVLTKKVPA